MDGALFTKQHRKQSGVDSTSEILIPTLKGVL